MLLAIAIAPKPHTIQIIKNISIQSPEVVIAKSVIGALRVVLGLDSAQFERGIGRVSRSNQQLVRNTQVASNAVRGLAASLGIVSAGAAARGFLSLTDQSKQLTAQLKLATAQTGSFAKAQSDVQRIAANTRGGLKDTADLYAVFARTSAELGISQEQVARITETVTKTFKISGASTAETAGATRQLIQAFQSGVLRGEEFNSVMENAPRLAKLMADSFNVPVGSLRAMAAEGTITADKLAAAFSDANFTDSIDAEFRELPVTFDEAMTQVHNAAILTFGEFDRGGQFSQALSNFIMDGQSGFSDLGDSARELGIDIRSTFAGLEDAFEPLLAGARSVFGSIGIEAQTLADSIRPLLGELDAMSRWVGKQGLAGRLLTGGSVSDWWNERPTRGTTLLADFNRGQARSENQRRGEMAEEDFRAFNGGRDAMGNRPVVLTGGGAASGGGKKTGGGKKGPSAESLRRRADAEAQRAADALRRFTDMVAREDADLSEALARLSGNTDELAEAELEQIEADRAARARAIQADDDLNAAQREQLLILNDDNAEAQRSLVRKQQHEDAMQKQERIAVAGLDLEIELLSLSSNLARTAAGQRDIELRILDMAFERERLALEGIKATSAATSAEWQIADARLKQLGELQSGARQQVIRQTQGPLESYLDRLPRTADEAREALERVQVDGIDGIIDGLADAATGARSLGDVFKSVTNQIIADLIRIQLRKAMVGALSSALGGMGGGLGFMGGSTASGMGAKSLAGLQSTFQSNLPGFATGGSFKVGGMPGVDRNIVAFKATRGEMVDIRTPGQSGKTDIQVVPSPYFDVVVDGRVMNAAPGIAQGGAALASQRSAFANSRRLA